MEDTYREPFHLPEWLVSARNGRTLHHRDSAKRWAPFGMQHARRVGSPTTACGVSVLDWELFWELEFPQAPESTCRDWRREVSYQQQFATRSATA